MFPLIPEKWLVGVDLGFGTFLWYALTLFLGGALWIMGVMEYTVDPRTNTDFHIVWGWSTMGVANSSFWLFSLLASDNFIKLLGPSIIRLINALAESSFMRVIFSFPSGSSFLDLHVLSSFRELFNSVLAFSACSFNSSFSFPVAIKLLGKINRYSSNYSTLDFESFKVACREAFFESTSFSFKAFFSLILNILTDSCSNLL